MQLRHLVKETRYAPTKRKRAKEILGEWHWSCHESNKMSKYDNILDATWENRSGFFSSTIPKKRTAPVQTLIYLFEYLQYIIRDKKKKKKTFFY
jgi:hypothetical protein